jgi:hypothetical protein
MKRLLVSSITLMILILTACNSNNDTNGVSQQEPSGESSEQASSVAGTNIVKFPENYEGCTLHDSGSWEYLRRAVHQS